MKYDLFFAIFCKSMDAKRAYKVISIHEQVSCIVSQALKNMRYLGSPAARDWLRLTDNNVMAIARASNSWSSPGSIMKHPAIC